MLLAVTLPVIALTAIVIKLESPGPVLYRQERTGYHGRPFTLLKFRSMRQDAESGGAPQWASQHDPRVTRIGAISLRPRLRARRRAALRQASGRSGQSTQRRILQASSRRLKL